MKKIVLILLAVFYSTIGFAQFTDDAEGRTRLFIKFQEKTTLSLIEGSGFNIEGDGNLVVQNMITNHLTIDVGLGLWYGSDINNQTGVDIMLGVTYTPVSPYYLFANIHPRFHVKKDSDEGGTIGDVATLYGYLSLGGGYMLKLSDTFSLYSETGFDFNRSTQISPSSNTTSSFDIKLFLIIGILIRNV